MPEEPAAADDLTIDDDEIVYRRIHRKQLYVEPDGDVRPNSGAVEDREDGISVFLHSVLVTLDLGPADVVEGYPGRLVARIRVGDLRALTLPPDATPAKCGITRDPDPPGEAPHKCSPAHALIHTPPNWGKARDRKVRKQIAAAAKLVPDVEGV